MGKNPQSQTGSRTRAFFQQPTEQGWAEFVEQYGPMVFAWSCGKGLQPADAEEVLQNVLVKLHAAMTRAPWDPKKGRLRSWLKTVTLNALSDYVRRRRADQAPDWLESIADDQELLADQIAEEEARRVAQAEAELRVGPKKWRVFYLRVFQAKSGEEVAQEIGISLGTVYNYFGEVSRVLAEEIKNVNGEND